MQEYVLQTNRLVKHYKNAVALQDLTMHVKRGEIYGFVGRNGAGKTTVIRMITGLIHKTSGSYQLFGVEDDADSINDVRRRISGIVENPSIYLNMNGYHNLLMQSKLLGRVDETEIEETLKLVGLPVAKKDKKMAKNYSLGMRQRLGIAIALMGDTDFLLLDEPTNGLDPEGIIEVRELLLKLNRERNITILISSHILGELSKLATSYGFIDQGRIVKEISARELEEQCQKCIRLEVSTVNDIGPVLEQELGILNYKIFDDHHVAIYDDIETTKLILTLSAHQINVVHLDIKNEDLEGYFINLIGGRHL